MSRLGTPPTAWPADSSRRWRSPSRPDSETDHVPEAGEVDELGQIAQDYRDLWGCVVSDRLDESLQRQLSSAVSGYTAGILLSGHWQP